MIVDCGGTPVLRFLSGVKYFLQSKHTMRLLTIAPSGNLGRLEPNEADFRRRHQEAQTRKACGPDRPPENAPSRHSHWHINLLLLHELLHCGQLLRLDGRGIVLPLVDIEFSLVSKKLHVAGHVLACRVLALFDLVKGFGEGEADKAGGCARH